MNEKTALLDRIARGNFHRPGGLKCAKLFSLDGEFFARLQSDIGRLVISNAPSEVANADHVTNWTKPYGRAVQFSLLNRSGRFDDTSVDHDRSVRNKSFHHAHEYPALGEFIALFPHAVNMRLNGMSPSGGLSPHEEHIVWRRGRRYYLRARFHLPIETNPHAVVLLDGDLFHFESGCIYFFNNGCIHSAKNEGETQRYHLVWDMLLTTDTIELMFGDASHPPLQRAPVDSRDLSPCGSVAVDKYEISGVGGRLYDLLHLDALKVSPPEWQNRYNAASYSLYRAVGRPTPIMLH
jgi:hypothetical protein